MDKLHFSINGYLLYVPITNYNIHHILLSYIFFHNYVWVNINEFHDLYHLISLYIYFYILPLDNFLRRNDRYFNTYVHLYVHIILCIQNHFFRLRFSILLFLFCNLNYYKVLYIYDLYYNNIIPHDLYFLYIYHNIQNTFFLQIDII